MTAVEWFFARDNKQQGPVSAAELKQLAQTGQLRQEDLVWREGMADWLPAGKVKGLFDEEAKPQPKAVSLAGAGATFEASAAAFERSREGSPRHFFDHFLESARLQFTSQFVDSTATMFAVLGHYGLYAAMAALFVFDVILAVRTKMLYLVVVALAWVLALVALQYIAGRFSGALQKLNAATPGRMASTAFLDCWALLHMLAGLIVPMGVTFWALQMGTYALILPAFGLFIILQFIAMLAINPESLHIEIVSETGAGEEAIGVLSFLVKIGLRLVPVAFGTGVLLGTVWMVIACGLTLTASPGEQSQPTPGIALVVPDEFSSAPHEAAAATMLIALVVPPEYGPATSAATTATTLMISAAAVPFVTYLIVLFLHLGIDMVRAVFSLPSKLDRLAAGQTAAKDDG